VYRAEFIDKSAIVKERFVKTYRLAALDKKLSHRRMSQEVRSMVRCRRHGIRAPAVYHMDLQRRLIYMEDIADGMIMRDYIMQLDTEEGSTTLEQLMELMGGVLAKMHNIDVVHGDLTTSNMVYNAETKEMTLIDFGLSYVSSLAEDKGVDLVRP